MELAFGIELVPIPSVAFIILTVGKGDPGHPTTTYNGPLLSSYISKFSPPAYAEEPVAVETLFLLRLCLRYPKTVDET
jgi:hypothetical protein